MMDRAQPAKNPRDSPAVAASSRSFGATKPAVHHGGSGDNWHMSWAGDDRQVVSLCDGYGWSETPKGMYNSKLLSIAGGPEDATVSWKFPDTRISYRRGRSALL